MNNEYWIFNSFAIDKKEAKHVYMTIKMEKEIIMWFILVKLTNMKKFGGAHTALRNITKGLPSSITSNKKGKKVIDEAAKELIKMGFLMAKLSTGEMHISLNPKNVRNIREFIEKHMR